MSIFCLGSINADYFYSVPHIPSPGETLAATGMSSGLGGKGANQSVAAARAGSTVHHIGAVGPGSDWILERLTSFGVGTEHIAILEEPTGHAIINVAADGENAIVILAGANGCQDLGRFQDAIVDAGRGDILLLQNETNLQVEAAKFATEIGLRVLYSAAPFDSQAAAAVLPYTDTLLLNETEAAQLEAALETTLHSLPVKNVIVTLGANGVRWIETETGNTVEIPGTPVKAVDTTGAGDTFAGYFAAGLDAGDSVPTALEFAGRAAALKVTRHGTADAIPSREEVLSFSS